jgi:hypothetical protein
MCVCGGGGGVCLSVCVSGYTFPHFSTDPLQIWREPSTSPWTIYVVSARNARAC